MIALMLGVPPVTTATGKRMAAHVSCNIYAVAVITVAACILSAPPSSAQPKDAEPATRQANATVLMSLPFNDRTDFEEAQRGFIASLPKGIMSSDGQRTIWSMKPYAFIVGDAPATVNPSLWRQEQLNNFHGLFKVADRLYQVRGLDDSNMTIVESDSGRHADRGGMCQGRLLPKSSPQAGCGDHLYAYPCGSFRWSEGRCERG